MGTIEIEVDDDLLDDVVHVEGPTDERGRLHMGSDFGDLDVEVLVVEAKQKASSEGQSAD